MGYWLRAHPGLTLSKVKEFIEHFNYADYGIYATAYCEHFGLSLLNICIKRMNY